MAFAVAFYSHALRGLAAERTADSSIRGRLAACITRRFIPAKFIQRSSRERVLYQRDAMILSPSVALPDLAFLTHTRRKLVTFYCVNGGIKWPDSADVR